VLLLDTEGIRAPEYFDLEGAELHDNRLATFAVLPVDACIVMAANEEDSGFKEVLPMVMLASKKSAMAEEHGGQMQAKLFFVYRSVDTNDTKKLLMYQRKLQEDLRRASHEIENLQINEVGKRALEYDNLLQPWISFKSSGLIQMRRRVM
jgi:hypothetical protein